MCSSRKYPYLPHRRDFVQEPPPLSKFQLSFKHFFTFFVLRELPISPGISNPFCGRRGEGEGEYGYFLEVLNGNNSMVVSHNLGLVDFGFRLVDSILWATEVFWGKI